MSDNKIKILGKSAPATIIGVIALGLICSLLYDIVVKPGVSSVGRFALDIFTLGSQKLKDYSYAAAAIDPTPLSALLVLLTIVTILPLPIILTLIIPYSKSRAKKEFIKILSEIEASGKKEDEYMKQLDKMIKDKIRKLRMTGITMMLPLLLVSFTAFMVHNHSVLVWRIFNANLIIVSPYIEESEMRIFKSNFASMRTKSEYMVIDKKIKEIARKNNLQLRDVELW